VQNPQITKLMASFFLHY